MDLITYRDTKGRGAIAALARAAQLPPQYLHHLIRGIRGMSWDQAERIARASGGVLVIEDMLRVNAAARKSYRAQKQSEAA